jgi:Rrf2 family protein
MTLLPRRSVLAIAAVVDIAYHARPTPIAAKALAARHGLPPRHLETLLQVLVRSGILKGVRGPRGGYELARERRKISLGEIVRAAAGDGEDQPHGDASANGGSRLVDEVVLPAVDRCAEAFLERLYEINVDDLCRDAQSHHVFGSSLPDYDFTI